MCFSATASLTASGLLTILSVLAFKTVRSSKSSRYLLIAAVPALFALQQLSEGQIWLYRDQGYENYIMHCAQLFLFFAFIIWPTWIPLSLWAIEKEKTRKNILGFILLFGIIYSGALSYTLFNYPVDAQIVNCHVVYSIATSTDYSTMFMIILYCIPILGPFFVSSMKHIWLFGLMVAASLVVTYIVWYEALTSIWCFFAALISGSIAYFLWRDE